MNEKNPSRILFIGTAPNLWVCDRVMGSVIAHCDRHARRRAQTTLVVAHLDVPDPAHAAAMDRDTHTVHGSLADRPEEARVVRHAERHPALGEHAARGSHRRESLRDRRVHAAVDDAHRLAHARTNRQMARAAADLVGLVDDETDRRVERVLYGHSELVRCGVGHESRS